MREALDTLEGQGLTSRLRDSRVPKFEHRARTVLNLRRDETAVICLLLLRGPQTPGELRSRSDRLHSFDDLTAVQSTLDRLASRQTATDESAPNRSAPHKNAPSEGPLVIVLPRQPGSRESRYAHLLGDPILESASHPPTANPKAGDEDRLARLEREVAELRQRLEAIESGIHSRE